MALKLGDRRSTLVETRASLELDGRMLDAKAPAQMILDCAQRFCDIRIFANPGVQGNHRIAVRQCPRMNMMDILHGRYGR